MGDLEDASALIALPDPWWKIGMEIEKYQRLITEMEKKGANSENTALLWMEVATRKDQYRVLTGNTYFPILDAPRGEKYALSKLFLNLRGFSWGKKKGWVGQIKTMLRPELLPLEAEASAYQGIRIGKTQIPGGKKTDFFTYVEEFDLRGVGCDGAVPAYIGDLTKCKLINMNWNLLKDRLPREIRSLESLTSLNLSGNQLTGSLDPESFECLTALKTLDVSFNSLDGSIPNVFNHMKRLSVLNLSGNRFTGDLPETFSCLRGLEVLKLNNNLLTGEIPDTFSCLTRLSEVNMSQNQFTKGIGSFNNCKALKRLSLNNNLLFNHLDPYISSLQSLELLYLHNNQLHGPLPKEFFLLSQLRYLNLSHNKLVGTIDSSVSNLTKLETFLLTGNEFYGPLPSTITGLKALRDFHIFATYPTELSEPKRQFTKKRFERVYKNGPSMHINSSIWHDVDVYGAERVLDDDDESLLSYLDHALRSKLMEQGKGADDDDSSVFSHNSKFSYLSREK